MARRRHAHTRPCAAAIAILCLATMSAAAAERTLDAAKCASLPGTGPMQVNSASMIDAKPLAVAERGLTPAARITPATPSFCRVLGHIKPVDPSAPNIRFQVNLPLQWNGRTVQYGGGGFLMVC